MEFNVELGIAKWIFKCLPKVRAAPGGTESGLRSVEIGTPYGTSFELAGARSKLDGTWRYALSNSRGQEQVGSGVRY